MELKEYRKRIHFYMTSMVFFEKLYDDKLISKGQYEYFEVSLALKYGLPVNSLIRLKFKVR